MGNNKQSSVEWYAKQSEILHYDYFTEHISKDEKNERLKQLKEQAKAMHKKEIMTTYKDGRLCIKPLEISLEDEYYNSTFGGNNEQQ